MIRVRKWNPAQRQMENTPITKISETEYYGYYVMRYVGTIDLADAHRDNDVDVVYKWNKKYHPRWYFGTYGLRNEQKCTEGNGCMKWDVWVVVKEDNPDWRAIPGTKYYDRLKDKDRKKKFLPVAMTEKDVEKWVEASKKVPGLYEYAV